MQDIKLTQAFEHRPGYAASRQGYPVSTEFGPCAKAQLGYLRDRMIGMGVNCEVIYTPGAKLSEARFVLCRGDEAVISVALQELWFDDDPPHHYRYDYNLYVDDPVNGTYRVDFSQGHTERKWPHRILETLQTALQTAAREYDLFPKVITLPFGALRKN